VPLPVELEDARILEDIVVSLDVNDEDCEECDECEETPDVLIL
jgi:hypothetical protein